MISPRDIDVEQTPIWILTYSGLPPFAATVDDQKVFFDYDQAKTAKNNAGPDARLWKAVLTATASISEWEEA